MPYRITPDKAHAAYEKTGYTPACRIFFRDGEACPITAVTIAQGYADEETIYNTIVSLTYTTSAGAPDGYTHGFMTAWDAYSERQEMEFARHEYDDAGYKAFVQGLNDARELREDFAERGIPGSY